MTQKRILEKKVALVTGASRGIGKGIAVQLGEAGALVYITGRTLKSENNLGSLEDTALEIKQRGGRCIPVQVDHEKDEQIVALFEKIEKEQNGQFDILVNNAYKGVESIVSNLSVKFWEQSPEIWDNINNVGLRNHYFCTVYASRMMVKRKSGLIINISSAGGMKYLFNVPYGVGKAACDRMAVDCGHELRKQNVAMISLYPGAVKTELLVHLNKERANKEKTLKEKPKLSLKKRKLAKHLFNSAESTEFSGKVIVELASDPDIMSYTGKILISAEYANDHDILDIDGRQISSHREFKYLLFLVLPDSMKFMTNYMPSFLKVPQFMIDIFTSKF